MWLVRRENAKVMCATAHTSGKEHVPIRFLPDLQLHSTLTMTKLSIYAALLYGVQSPLASHFDGCGGFCGLAAVLTSLPSGCAGWSSRLPFLTALDSYAIKPKRSHVYQHGQIHRSSIIITAAVWAITPGIDADKPRLPTGGRAATPRSFKPRRQRC